MSNWLDFRSIKRDANLASVLRHYGVVLRRSGQDQYRGCCPIHRGEGRDAFHVNVARNVFHCFACGAGGTVLDFIAVMEGCSLYEAAEHLRTITGGLGQYRPRLQADELVTKRKRGCSPLSSGPGLMHDRLIIPVHNAAGELVAYCGRSVDQTPPRYRVPPGFAKSEILFNLHRATAAGAGSVVIVEGFFDCMKVHQAGISSVVALMGSALYEPQRHALLERFREVRLLLDGDLAGRNASRTVAAKLRSHCQVEVVDLPVDTQPDQLSMEDIRQILSPPVRRRLELR